MRKIAYSIDYRGINEEHLSFIFRGADVETLLKVFSFLCPINGGGIAKNFKLKQEHDVCYRQGKGYWRFAVILYEPNLAFTSIEDISLLVEARMKAEIKCEIIKLPLDDFLNV